VCGGVERCVEDEGMSVENVGGGRAFYRRNEGGGGGENSKFKIFGLIGPQSCLRHNGASIGPPCRDVPCQAR